LYDVIFSTRRRARIPRGRSWILVWAGAISIHSSYIPGVVLFFFSVLSVFRARPPASFFSYGG
jgi:hypothetical protein